MPRRARLALPLFTAAALVLGLLSASTSATAATPTPAPAALDSTDGTAMLGYRLYDLTPGVTQLRSLDALGDDGRVAGRMVNQDGTALEPFVWTPGRPWDTIPTVPGSVNHVEAFDPKGNLYGSAGGGVTVENPALYQWKPLDGGGYSEPESILPWSDLGPHGIENVMAANTRGHLLVDGTVTAVVRGGVPSKFTGLDGNPLVANDMNESDTVVGYTRVDPDGASGSLPTFEEPTIWNGGGAPSSLGFPPIVNLSAAALKLNDTGQVLVEAYWGTDRTPFVRNQDGSWHVINPPATAPSDTVVRAIDLNDRGEAVGVHGTPTTGSHAFVWDGQRTITLDDLVAPSQNWQLTDVVGINDKGMIAGTGFHNGFETAWLAVPADPVVFVPGAGASSLFSFRDGRPESELWMDCSQSRELLSVFSADIEADRAPAKSGAVDALRHETCFGLSEVVDPGLDIYGTLLDRLRATGTYREYSVDRHMERATTAGCDLTQQSRSPSLFVYAYDWRADNAVNAAGLADYIGCIKKFWPTRKVDVLTHSMGSLVARRYVLDHPGDSNVDRLITIGAPWLGAPKLVNVLQTGDFAPGPVNGDKDVIKRITAGFPAAHQLMAGRVYGDAASVPVIRENGWDLNGKDGDHQTYTYDQVKTLLDAQSPKTTPGTTADTFQSYSTGVGDQTDWRTDASDVKYTHILGLQAGAQTIGSVVANRALVCTGTFTQTCTTQNFISQHLICGDGTVPLVSAERAGHGVDYNAPDAEMLLYRSPDTEHNHSVEHTGMAANGEIDQAIIDRLLSDDPLPAADHSWLGKPGDDEFSCIAGSSPPTGLTAAAAPTEPAPGTSLRYVSVLGGNNLTVTDAHSHSTDRSGGTNGYVNGVTLFASDRPDAGMATMPVSATQGYTTSFTATSQPFALTLLEGSQAHPTAATRWVDVSVPPGARVELATAADGADVVRVDRDGDGAAEDVVAPTTRLGGADAADTTPPEVSAVGVTASGSTRYAVTATDDASGVDKIMWSTDGVHFSRYDDPLDLPATATLTAYAQDRAGNRSAPYTVKVADVPPGLLTTATLTPAPTGSGWSAGPVTLDLRAQSSDGASGIASLSYRTKGAAGNLEKTVTGDTTSLSITAVGSSTVTFWATAADGTKEPDRTVQVRVDGAAPTVVVKTPASNSATATLASIGGTASDDAAGVTDIDVELRNNTGRWWNGQQWVETENWLPTAGAATWARTTGLPAGSDLPAGGYRLRARAVDGAGRTTVSAALAFTIAPSAGLIIHELPDSIDSDTSGVAVNTQGVAAGVSTQHGNAIPARWAAGQHQLLGLTTGYTGGHAEAIDEAGNPYGYESSETIAGRPTRWDGRTGAPTTLGTLAGGQGAVAAVTADGTVAAGWSTIAGNVRMPVRWNGAQIEALPLLAGATSGEANDVAADGTIVGWLSMPGGVRAVNWTPSGVRPVSTPELSTSRATAINDLGTIVGTYTDSAGRTRGFINTAGHAETLPSAFTATSLTPNAISNTGSVVGEFTTTSATHAFLMEPGQAAVDLDTVLPAGDGWKTVRANDVNDLGQIIGFGIKNALPRAFLVSVQHAPVAPDATATTSMGVAVDIDVRAYDPDVLDTVTLRVQGPAGHGTVSVADGKLRYTPAAGFHGTDRFSYVVDDATMTSAPGEVEIAVTGSGSNTAPVAHDSEIIATAAQPVPVNLAADDADEDPLSYRIVTGPAHGVLSGAGADRSYTPAAGFSGSDSFTWVAFDGTVDSALATVTITVTAAANQAPSVTLSVPQTAPEGAAVELSAPATDVDGDRLSWTWTASSGALTGSGDKVTLHAGNGPADINVTVVVSDGKASVTKTAQLHVTNVAPVVNAGADITVPWGTSTQLNGTVSDAGAEDSAAGLSPGWLFGDGGSASGVEVSHAWAAAGTFTATLRATDRDGATGTDTVTVQVVKHQPALQVAATGGAFGTASIRATLTDTSSGGAALANRPVVFTVDGKVNPAVTSDANGVATLAAGSLPPGAHTLSASAVEDARYLGVASTPTTVQVQQSAGTAAGTMMVKEGIAVFGVSADGRTVKGGIIWTDKSGTFTVACATAFGITLTAKGKGAAWFAGTSGKHSILMYVEDNSVLGNGDVLRVWVDGVLRTATGARLLGNVLVR